MFPTDVGIQPDGAGPEAEDAWLRLAVVPRALAHPGRPAHAVGRAAGRAAAARGVLARHDQFLALTAAAAVTTTLRLGTGITLVAQHDPLWLAKEVASLDVISGGRFLFGIGYGWNHEEMESHGVDIATGGRVVREKILACKELWTKDEAEFHGEYVNFEPSWAWPKPVQLRTRRSSSGRRRPTCTSATSSSTATCGCRSRVGGRSRRRGAGCARPRRRRVVTRRRCSLGMFGANPTADNLARLRDAGATFATLVLPPLDRNAALATMDTYAPFVEEFNRTSVN